MGKEGDHWAAAPFKEFLNHQMEVGCLVALSERGILVLSRAPALLEAVAQWVDGETEERKAERIDEAREDAKLAQREIDTGFALLHAQATVSLWGSLECLVRDFLVEWLARQPGAGDLEPVRKIKISLGEYDAMAPEQRRRYIVESLDRDVQAPLRQGVDRFEALLAVFGLSGPVHDDIKRDLFELCNVRNILVHRRGVADSRFVKACPWLGLKPGGTVRVTHDSFDRYGSATTKYVTVLMKRVTARLGPSTPREGHALDGAVDLPQ
jgi:hypothetical protein